MTSLDDYAIDAADSSHEEFLWQALYYAAHMNEESGVTPGSAKTNPALAPYVTGWGKAAGDLGFVAIERQRGRFMGAAWLRRMPQEWPLYRHVDRTIPEMAIAVLPSFLGRGIGTELLTTLIRAAGKHYSGIALSVRDNNPARRLYERLGFRAVAIITNRVGGSSTVMKLDLR